MFSEVDPYAWAFLASLPGVSIGLAVVGCLAMELTAGGLNMGEGRLDQLYITSQMEPVR